MKIDPETIDKLEVLAKLKFSDAERAGIMSDLENVTAFFDKIAALDTGNVEPLVYMNSEPNKLRPDEARILTNQTEALQNAPRSDEEFFIVPKVIKGK
ncbi:Asp-tRNA(Asn)/Glu-tRNA(Gln) amidotransferase GatCAB subunit C [Sphingobacteriales bacterium UPWRP_1]|nr:aspartyl/glutamyl-tRNA(Asn/Gln) amidotransferase subunit C [Sphingobacteriales bacterium TSM_CSM]PSJ78139.1 Asp-tRNA(Asn)/Glu-tRNA(Gln) amidotransferase GatCAB subunit C [Sphingobacteriales bacterium UPWRP_1]